MNLGERIRLPIIDMNEQGIGVGRVGGMVVFVPSLAAGDLADIRITSIRSRFAEAAVERIITPSPHRVSPSCHADGCGGCPLLFVSYDYENLVKKNTVSAALRRSGLDYSLVENTVFPSNRFGYRNKMSLHWDESTGSFGYCHPHSQNTVSFSGCLICPDVFSKIVSHINRSDDLLKPLSPTELIIRSFEDQVAVSLYASAPDGETFHHLSERLKRAFPGIVLNFFTPDGNPYGPSCFLTDRIGQMSFRFSTETFRQVNKEAFELLLNLLKNIAAEKPFRSAADLYCGSGVIGLTLARAFPRADFTGIEINSEAVDDAKENAILNQIDNIRFFCVDAASFRSVVGRVELLVVDPPRAGLSLQMRRELISLHPDRILYVSCNPQTLARDMSEIARSQYEIRRVVPVNMFPSTQHVETVVLMTRTE